MIEVEQTILTKEEGGNCFAACLASILETPLDVVPNAATYWARGDFDGGWEVIEQWLLDLGVVLESYAVEDLRGWWPTGYWGGIVPSEFLEGETHATVFEGQRFRWNPRPGGRDYYLGEVVTVDRLIVADPARLARSLARLSPSVADEIRPYLRLAG